MSVLSILLAFYRQCCESSALKSLEPLKKRIDSLEQNAASAYTGKMPPVKQKEQPHIQFAIQHSVVEQLVLFLSQQKIRIH
jgi:hypothetical protein